MKKTLMSLFAALLCSFFVCTAALADFVIADNPFADVSDDAAYADAVVWAKENGVTKGTSATTFSPSVSCSRGQVVTFLWRAAGSPEPTAAERVFIDVKETDYFSDAVSWAVENGITNGTSATTFSPDLVCSEAQILTFLWRANGSPAAPAVNTPAETYADDAYYKTAVAWAYGKGMLGQGFSCDAPCPRSNIVQYLYTNAGSPLVVITDIISSSAFIDPIADWDQYDALIAQIKAETDTARRAELMHKAEDILMATNCVIPLYYYNDIYLMKDYVSGVYSNPYATKFFMYASLGNGSDTLRLNFSSEPDYLDPALNSSVDGACLAANSFSGLYTYDATGKPAPACASGYTVSNDGLTYTVTLKDDLKWSDGSALTAGDFVYSWKRAASTTTAADYAYMFDVIKGYPNDLAVSAPNARTLVFELNAPCAYMEDLMAFPTFYPVKQSAVESYADWRNDPGGWCREAGFVSNGAYVCTGWNHGVSMTYEKNPYWYDADKVTVEKLELMLSADGAAVYDAYNAGLLDFMDSDFIDDIDSLLSNPEFHIVDELGTFYVAFNAKSSIFDGKTPEQAACMRAACMILIDRAYICECIGQTGQAAANAFIPLGMADGNGGLFKADAEDGYFDAYAINDRYDETVELARTLLKAAGYKFGDDGKLSAETPLRLEYLTNVTPGLITIAESIRQDLSVIGIDLNIKTQNWLEFLNTRHTGNFDFAREGWIADFNDPINMLEMWTTVSGNNDCQFGR